MLQRPTDDIPLPPSPNDPVPTPDPVNMAMKQYLTYGFAAGYFVLLVLLTVYWLSFNHPNLEAPVLVGIGIFAGAAQGIVGNFVGVTTHNNGVMRGFSLSRK